MRLRKPSRRLRFKTSSHDVLMSAFSVQETSRKRLLFAAASLLVLTFSAAVAQAQKYTSIVVFGDSLSDVGNDAIVTAASFPYLPVPSPAGGDYTYGRFTDGADTAPPALNYFGVWVEQLQALLPGVPVIRASLAGGNDYAYGFATTGKGSAAFTYGPGDEFSVPIDNMGLQITTYLKTHPKINGHTLFVVWGGAINVLYATSSKDVVKGAVEETADVQRLIDAGATQIIVPNLPPLGDVPRLNGSPTTSVPANEAATAFNETLEVGLDALPIINFFRGVHIFKLDIFSLFKNILASPSAYSLVNVTSPSQLQPVDPDTYLFWDDLHPTTRGHNLVALSAFKLIAPSACVSLRAEPGEASCASLPQFGAEVF